MALLRDQNQERLQRSIELLTQVADDLQAQLDQQLRQPISPNKAGGFLKLGLHIESINSMAGALHEIREHRHLMERRPHV